MADYRPKVPLNMKIRLREEAGGKCANPGCPTRVTELHHIQEWAVYKTHDEQHMIAVCSTCHTAIHHGEIDLSDDVVYAWKTIPRPNYLTRDYLYVEPGGSPRILLGSMAVQGSAGAIVFDFSSTNRLSFSVRDTEILHVNITVADLDGNELLRVVDNNVRCEPDANIEYRYAPGRLLVMGGPPERFLPGWVVSLMKRWQVGYAADGRITLLSLTVEKPGLVRVEGSWSSPSGTFLVDHEALHIFAYPPSGYVSVTGHGEDTVLVWTGPITSAMFQFG